MKVDKISIKSVVEDFLDFTQEDLEIDESLILKFADDAISRFIDSEHLVFGIYLLPVKNFKAELPRGFKFVAQAAFQFGPPRPNLREQVIEWNQDILGTDCTLVTNLECPDCYEKPIIVSDINRIYETAHPELYTQNMFHFLRAGGTTGRGVASGYSDQFYLMEPAMSSFQNIPMHVSECLNLKVESQVQYSITPPMISVNQKEGVILLACYTEDLDEDGYRKVPNHPMAFEAINRYIEERLAYIQFRKTRSQADANFYQTTLQLKEQAIARARTELGAPEADEFRAFMDSFWRRVIPNYSARQTLYNNRKDPFFRGIHKWSPNSL